MQLSRVLRWVGWYEDVDPFLKEMLPILTVYRMIGCFPFTIDESGRLRMNFLSFSGVQCFVVILYLSGTSILGLSRALKTVDVTDDDIVYKRIATIFAGSFELCIIICIFSNWNSFVKYFWQWDNFNVAYTKLFGSPPKLRYRKYIVLMVFGCLLITILIHPHISSSMDIKKQTYYEDVSIIFIRAVSMIHHLFFCFAARELKDVGGSIHSKLKNTMNRANVNPEELRDIRRLWIQCSHLCRDTGGCIANVFVTIFGIFAVFISMLATHIIMRVRNDQEGIYMLLCLLSLYLIVLMTPFWVAEVASNEVGRPLQTVVMTRNGLFMNHLLADEIELMLEAMETNYPHFAIGGFLICSMHSFVKMMLTVLLNTVFLVQSTMA